MGSGEDVRERQLHNAAVVFEGTFVGQVAHEEHSSAMWLFDVFRRGGVGEVVVSRNQALVCDAEHQGSFPSTAHVTPVTDLLGVEFVAVDDGVVDSLPSWQSIRCRNVLG